MGQYWTMLSIHPDTVVVNNIDGVGVGHIRRTTMLGKGNMTSIANGRGYSFCSKLLSILSKDDILALTRATHATLYPEPLRAISLANMRM